MAITAEAFKGRKLTLVVSVTIIASLVFILIDRIVREAERVERAHFELRLNELRSILLLKQLEIMTKGGKVLKSELAGENPMQWLKGWPQSRPAYYRGEGRLSQFRSTPGYWVYDPVERVIAYQPKADSWRDELLESRDLDTRQLPLDGGVWMKFQVVPVFESRTFKSIELQAIE